MTEKELYQWFLSLTPAYLPPTPFELKPSAIVHDATLWHAATRAEVKTALAALINQTIYSPRQRTGALQTDLVRLRALKSAKS